MSQLNFIAHINDNNEEQTLKEHCQNVAAYTANNLQAVHLQKLGYLVGLVHDMGKATKKFDTYIRQAHAGVAVRRGSVNHTFAAVIYIWEKYHKGEDDFQLLTAEFIAYAAGAHHGLFDCVGLEKAGVGDFLYRLQKDRAEIGYEEALQNYFAVVTTEAEIDQLFAAAVAEVQAAVDTIAEPFSRGLVARLLVSALIDGDRQDTAEFMGDKQCAKQSGDEAFWQRNLQFCEAELAKFKQDSEIQLARKYISDACRKKAEEPGGIYQLNVPTGSGKTLAAHFFALAHAAKYGKDRVIYIIPLLSVLEQNSKVIRAYMLDQDMVAEHHSNVLVEENNTDELKQYELVVDTWGAPVIVSTLVQFLNILFLDKTSAIRRMQALCNSVIVIDEIQSLPWKVTSMFIESLNFLAEFCNCTIVLSSATQPHFERLKVKLHFAEQKDLVMPDATLFKAFERTTIVDQTKSGGYTTQEIADFADELLRTVSSALIICNTKKTAVDLHRLAQGHDYTCYHLSTGMCMAHRLAVIKQINQTLEYNKTAKQKQKLLCVSTQLVEAGVDFSFERVIRLVAGMDNIVQSAGRENRSGDYGGICPCYIMNLQNENIIRLQEIKQRQDATEKLLHSFRTFPEQYDHNLASEKSIDMYYTCLFQSLEKRDTLKYIVLIHSVRQSLFTLLKRDRNDKLGQILTQPFQTVGAHFEVFDMKNQDVLVPYGTEGKQLISDLLSNTIKYDLPKRKSLLKQANQYAINLFHHQINQLGNKIMRYQLDGEAVYILDESCYDAKMEGIGFQLEGEMETLIF